MYRNRACTFVVQYEAKFASASYFSCLWTWADPEHYCATRHTSFVVNGPAWLEIPHHYSKSGSEAPVQKLYFI